MKSARGLVPFGHLGWAYRGLDEFWARATEYLADGIAEGQSVEYVGDAPADQLRTQLAAHADATGFADSDRVAVTPVTEFYVFEPNGTVVDPGASVIKRTDATHAAVEAGYSEFRAVVDCRAVVMTPDQREAFARFEYLIDHVMAEHPVSALCAYDVTQLGDAAAELICLHPFVNPGSTRFRLYAEPHSQFDRSGTLFVSGEESMTTALRRTGPLSAGENLRLDDRDMTLSLVRDTGTATIGNSSVLDVPVEHRTPPVPPAQAAWMRASALRDLTRARRFARDRARQCGMDPQQRVEDLVLIVTELVTAGLTRDKSPCELALWRDEDDLCCTVHDHGHLANPLDGYRLALHSGGWALPIVHRLVDQLAIHTGPDGTTLHIRMALA